MINHAALSSRRIPANARINIFSPLYTDPLVLAVLHTTILLIRNTSVSIMSGFNDVEPIARVLGQLKANALNVTALSGADTVGKATWLKMEVISLVLRSSY